MRSARSSHFGRGILSVRPLYRLYEAMVDSVLTARDLYLKPGGLVVPAQCSILLAALQDDEYIAESIDYWNNVYDFKMSAMNDKVGKEADVRIYKPEGVISTVAGIKVGHRRARHLCCAM